MKKIWICALIVLALFVCTSPAQAQEADTYMYHDVTIYKIHDYKDAYIILYARHDKGIGQLVIPKNWAKETPKKLTLRNMPKQISPYMSIYYNTNGFDHIQLTLPLSRQHSVWGASVSGDSFGDNSSTTTLEKFEY
jgi:hypothetical protein